MREQVLELVSRHLKHKLNPSGGGNFVTKCPFHKGGEEKKPSFSVNPDKGVFQCFTCHVSGDIEYLLKLLGLPSFQIDVEIKHIKPFLEKNKEQLRFEKQHQFSKGTNPFEVPIELPEQLLGVYDWMPLKLVEQGFQPEVLQKMEVGFDRNQQRITYPIRDLYGTLGGIAGGATLDWQSPKYKVYQGGGRDQWNRKYFGDFGDWFDEQYPGYRFENHNYLWNFHRVLKNLRATSDPNATVYLVEGYKACMWMIQSGFENTVALMGSYVSEMQIQSLSLLTCNVVLFLDNDQAGRKATVMVGELLFRKMYGRIWVVPYPQEDDETQPDDYESEGVRQFVEAKRPFLQYQVEAMLSNQELREKIEKRRRKIWH